MNFLERPYGQFRWNIPTSKEISKGTQLPQGVAT